LFIQILNLQAFVLNQKLKLMKIQLLNRNHFAAIQEISDAQFGFNYLDNNYFESFLSDKNLALVALSEREIVGMTLIKIGTRDEIAADFLVGAEFIKEKFNSKTTLALRKHLAVKKGFESKGIGSFMVEKGMQELNKKFVDAILSIVWKEGSSAALHKILTDQGSMPLTSFPNYWANDSIEKQYICPACKVIPCNCSAILYAKFITI
jgi:predicted N-acetyltransferase YhbS